MNGEEPDYLWDRSGPPEPDVERLEQTLSAYRATERPLRMAAPPSRGLSVRAWRMGFALAACFVIALGVFAVRAYRMAHSGWYFAAESGRVRVDGKTVRAGILRVGESLETKVGERVRLRVADIGELELRDSSHLELVESRTGRHRLVLKYGTLHARVTAPPAVFVVDTPAVRAVDLGCEYTLTVDAAGKNGHLQVDAGWVQLQYNYVQSLVPQGAAADIQGAGDITPPYFPDASPPFVESLRKFSFEDGLGEATRMELLQAMLHEARVRDSYTLLNLFRRAITDAERAAIYDRLNELVPAPGDVNREAVVRGDRNADEHWWAPVRKALGISAIHKKGPLNLGPFPGRE